jgi:hypothetical protein
MEQYKPEEILLAQVKSYLVLAKRLKSGYYLARAKQTLEHYYEHRANRTAKFAA